MATFIELVAELEYETYARESGEVLCSGIIDHKTWFGLMRTYDLDWPCPTCGAQI